MLSVVSGGPAVLLGLGICAVGAWLLKTNGAPLETRWYKAWVDRRPGWYRWYVRRSGPWFMVGAGALLAVLWTIEIVVKALS